MSAEWYPDGSALLVAHSFEARSELCRYDLATRELVRVGHPAGYGLGRDGPARRQRWSTCGRRPPQPPQVRSTTGGVVLDPPGMKAPGVGAGGGRLGGRARAAGSTRWCSGRRAATGPFPTVFDIHGGPTWHDSDAFAAGPAAWVDHGYAVVRVNYRGSTGYGRAWTDALKHRVGLIELEDIAAVREWAVASGLADPDRLVLAGGSWGGYLTLLGLGTQPDAWALGLAAVPVADYVTAYHDEMEALKAMDRTLLGGTPEEVPERFEASSPLTYVDAVRAPVYISAGVNDPRCPIRQVENYVERLAARGAVARGVPVRRGARLAGRGGADQAGAAGDRLRSRAPGTAGGPGRPRACTGRGAAPRARGRVPYRGGVYRFLLTPRWWGINIFVVLAIPFCVFMGSWQLGRFEDRVDTHQEAEQKPGPGEQKAAPARRAAAGRQGDVRAAGDGHRAVRRSSSWCRTGSWTASAARTC